MQRWRVRTCRVWNLNMAPVSPPHTAAGFPPGPSDTGAAIAITYPSASSITAGLRPIPVLPSPLCTEAGGTGLLDLRAWAGLEARGLKYHVLGTRSGESFSTRLLEGSGALWKPLAPARLSPEDVSLDGPRRLLALPPRPRQAAHLPGSWGQDLGRLGLPRAGNWGHTPRVSVGWPALCLGGRWRWHRGWGGSERVVVGRGGKGRSHWGLAHCPEPARDHTGQGRARPARLGYGIAALACEAATKKGPI